MEYNTSELAKKHELSRKTCSVTRDHKKDQVIIVEEVSRNNKEGAVARSEVYYRFFEDRGVENLNDYISEAKASATLEFLGLSPHTAVVNQCDTDSVAEEEPKKAASKKKAEKKAASKKSAKKAKAPIPQEEPTKVEDDDANLFDEVDELDDDGAGSDAEAAPILYDKASREHTSHLKPLIQKILGKDWKTSDAKKTKVRALTAALNGKVAVTDVEGNLMKSFPQFVAKFLKSK